MDGADLQSVPSKPIDVLASMEGKRVILFKSKLAFEKKLN